MHGLRPRGALRVVGLMLCALAILAVAVPAAGYAKALNGKSIRLTEQPQHLVLPAHSTYGIYVTDADNSGYSERCAAADADGRQIRLAEPSWTVTSSDTETVDLVYDTGSGRVTIRCSVPGEQVATRPVPDNREILLGIVLAATLGCAGAAILIVTFIGRPSRRPIDPSVVATGPGARGGSSG